MSEKRLRAVLLTVLIAVSMACRAVPSPSSSAPATIALLPTATSVSPAATTTPLPTRQLLSPDARLTESLWQWVSYTGGKGVEEHIKSPEKYQIRFLADGQVQITADCNMARSTYSVKDEQIDFGDMISTKVACEPGSLYDRFLANLQMVFSYAFDNGDLLLILRMDGGELRFSPAR